MRSLLKHPGRAWAAATALMLLGGIATGALLGWRHEGAGPRALLWQRDTPLEFWRCWSAAFVHFDARHLVFNAAGALLIGVFGVATALPRRAALGWMLAWPLTHAGLWLLPGPDRYAGLSGVLHAGAGVACVFTLVQGRGLQRGLGAALGLALLAKLLQERAWLEPLQQQGAWNFPIAVAAHATGALGGALVAALMLAKAPRQGPAAGGEG